MSSPSLPLQPPAAPTPRVKPALRGVSHQFAAFTALGAGAVLVALAPGASARVGCAIYALSLAGLLGISAFYHVPMWPQSTRSWLKRLDHSAIFVLIAGTYTPICMLALPAPAGTRLLWYIWVGAGAGILRVLLWPGAPRALIAGIYIALGWMVVAYLPELRAGLSTSGLALLAAGGLFYTSGAVVYARRWPDPRPRIFGYHEVFHLLVIAAAGCHFAAVLGLVRGEG